MLIHTQIGKLILMITRILVEEHFIWDLASFHGLVGNKTPLLYILLRKNTLLMHLVVLNFYG